MEPKAALLRLQVPATCPCPEPFLMKPFIPNFRFLKYTLFPILLQNFLTNFLLVPRKIFENLL